MASGQRRRGEREVNGRRGRKSILVSKEESIEIIAVFVSSTGIVTLPGHKSGIPNTCINYKGLSEKGLQQLHVGQDVAEKYITRRL